MASKKATVRAAKALLAPSPEEKAALQLLAKNTECIIRIEKTLAMLVKAMCRESRMNYAFSTPVSSVAGGEK